LEVRRTRRVEDGIYLILTRNCDGRGWLGKTDGGSEQLGLPSGRPAREAFNRRGSWRGIGEGVSLLRPSIRMEHLSVVGHNSGKPLLVN
jgi:hypothetical protein